jgi:hypothetical protein
MVTHLRGTKAVKTGAWFTKAALEKSYKEANEDYLNKVPPSQRRGVFKVLRGEVYIWAGIPSKNEVARKEGMKTLTRQGFGRIVLFKGEFYVAR